MATATRGSKTGTTEDNSATTGADAKPANSDDMPVVYARKKKKRKKKYSTGTRDLQRVAEGTTRSADRLAQAVADGISAHRKKSNKSARKKRDGAVHDVVQNVGTGLSAALSTASQAPLDLTRRISLKRLTRLVTPIPLNVFFK